MQSTSKFLKVKCNDCENEQLIFSRAASVVNCNVCGTTLAEPRGGLARLKGEVTGEYA